MLTTIQAQEKESIDQHLKEGKELLFYGKYLEASEKFQRALTISKETTHYPQIAAAYNGLSQACDYQAQLIKAFEYAELAFDFSKKNAELGKKATADALDNMAIVQGKMGEAVKSLQNHQAALAIRQEYFKKDTLQLIQSHFNVGVAFHKNRKLEEAFNEFDTALKIAHKETPELIILHADIHEAIGFLNYDLGKHDAALSQFEKTLQLVQKVHKDNHPYFGRVYNDLGLIYTAKEEFNESLAYYNKALSVSIKNYGVDKHDEQVRIHFNIGMVYYSLGKTEKALFHTLKTLELGTKFYGAYHPQMYYPYSQLGNIYGDERSLPYLDKALKIALSAPKINYVIVSYQYEYHANIHQKIGNYDEALKFLNMSLAIRQKLNGLQNTTTIKTYHHIAKLYLAMKNFDKALQFTETAITNNKLTNIDDTNRFLSASYVNSDLPLEMTKTKADIFLSKFEETQKKEFLIESLKLYKEAITYIDLARKSKRNYQDKITFSEAVKAVYAKNIHTTLLLNSLDDTNVSLESAFYNSEKSKAHVLRTLLKNSEAKRKTNLHKDILALEKTINSQLSSLQSQILTEATKQDSDTVKLYALQGKFFDITTRKDSLEKSIEAQFPKYYKLKYENSSIQIEALQQKLNDSTTFLEFFRDQHSLYTFVISKHAFHVKKLEINDLDERIEALNNAITTKDETAFTQNASYLYKKLVAPIKKHLVGNELIIVPDESLWHLQFDLLLTEDTQKSYLLYDYVISYANSANVLFDETKKSKRENLQKECIAFSYTSKDSIQQYTNTIALSDLRNSNIDLPGTRKEITEISKILEGSYFYGTNANETNFKQYANQFKIIHLALHGDIDNQDSNNLKIYFSEGSTNEDDKLFGHELYNLHIPASLVVLSACNTGNGQINKAEGIQSLGNAFQYAGAKSLLLSSWEISDKTTPEVMRYFYQHLKDGLPKHKALQQAKIDFLKNSDHFTSAPFYWGSFYLLGDTTPIPLESNNTFTTVFLIISFVLLAVSLLYIFTRKKRQF
ncbi:CHAT domain-containing protein [Kordia sp.]|uniref:CHAT domain-containing protein n=1 Tax=Kordia sp. TaxID=1965332 RepID=UPI003B5C6840